MGLDIFHFKLTHTPIDKNDFITTDHWVDSCNVPFENYSHFLTDVQEYDFDRSIAIVKNKSDYEVLSKSGSLHEGYLKVFIGDMESIGDDIVKFIVSEGLHKFKRVDMGIEESTIHVKYNSIGFGELVMRKGMYYDEIGYQRKGMNKEFTSILRSINTGVKERILSLRGHV